MANFSWFYFLNLIPDLGEHSFSRIIDSFLLNPSIRELKIDGITSYVANLTNLDSSLTDKCGEKILELIQKTDINKLEVDISCISSADYIFSFEYPGKFSDQMKKMFEDAMKQKLNSKKRVQEENDKIPIQLVSDTIGSGENKKVIIEDFIVCKLPLHDIYQSFHRKISKTITLHSFRQL